MEVAPGTFCPSSDSSFLEAAREANVARTFVKPFDVREVVRARARAHRLI
jgi:hypothetical protein